MALYQWNPANLSVLVIHPDEGQHLVTGFAPDSFVVVDPAEDMWGDRSSSDGKVVTRSKINNPIGEIAITLEMASPSNEYLQRVLGHDRSHEIGTVGGICAVSVVDDKGRERADAAHAWIRRQPGHTYGADPGTRGWVFRAADLVIYTGGSSQVP